MIFQNKNGTQTLNNLLMYYKQFLHYKNHQLRNNALQEVLPNLRKQISLIFLLSMLKMSQPKHVFHFILVSLYLYKKTTEKNSYTGIHF
jgi:hypothetical protein